MQSSFGAVTVGPEEPFRPGNRASAVTELSLPAVKR